MQSESAGSALELCTRSPFLHPMRSVLASVWLDCICRCVIVTPPRKPALRRGPTVGLFGMANEKNAAAVALGRLGGLKGGKARAKKLTREQRAERGRKAAMARGASRGKKTSISVMP